MKILFSNSPWWESTPTGLRYGIRAGSRWPFTMQAHCAPDSWTFGGYLPFPFFLGYAASYLQAAMPDATVTVRDSLALRESYHAFFQWLASAAPDWVVVESATPSWQHDRQVIRLIAKHAPTARVVLTGTITADPRRTTEALAEPNVVACVKGEYEKGVVHVIRDGATGVIEHRLLTKDEMNAAPFPLIPSDTWNHYWDACPKGNEHPQLQFWASRGCYAKCQFCAWPAVMTGNDPDGTKKRSVRFYSKEYVSAFLKEACGRYEYRSLLLDDDTFNLHEKHTMEMCEVLGAHGLPWSAMCRADTLSRDGWKAMKAAGCIGVKLGFESGSQRVIDKIINKGLDLKEAEETARYVRSLGLSVHGTFTIGHPGERPDEAQMTLDLIKRLYETGGINTHQLSGTAVIEGTPLSGILNGGHYDAYPDARIDMGFSPDTDGQKKIEGMLR